MGTAWVICEAPLSNEYFYSGDKEKMITGIADSG